MLPLKEEYIFVIHIVTMYDNNRLTTRITHQITLQIQQKKEEDNNEDNDGTVLIKAGITSTTDDCIIFFLLPYLYLCHSCLLSSNN